MMSTHNGREEFKFNPYPRQRGSHQKDRSARKKAVDYGVLFSVRVRMRLISIKTIGIRSGFA